MRLGVLVSGCFWVNRWNICTVRHKGKFSRTFPGFSGLHRAICSEQIVIECADKRSEEPCDLGSGVDFCWKVLGRLEFFQLLCFDRSSAPFHHAAAVLAPALAPRSEEHTSELQSLMRISYAVFCLKKKKK